MASCGIPNPPNENQIANDIIPKIASKVIDNPFGWGENNYPIEFESLTIEKRQTNDKSDNVYCIVDLKNEIYHCKKYVVCHYNYYDQGGWILDEYSGYKNTECTVISNPFDDNSIFNALLNYEYTLNHYKTMDLAGVSFDSESDTIVYTYDITKKIDDEIYAGKAILTLAFDGSGWKPDLEKPSNQELLLIKS